MEWTRGGWGLSVAVLCAVVGGGRAMGMEWTRGEMSAVPVRDGRAPVIDGALDDWDLNAQEPAYLAEPTARKQNVQWAFMYDDDALYIAVDSALPDRPLYNPNSPLDAFWMGDLAQIRLAADPALPYPLSRERDRDNARIVHLGLWKNTTTGVDYLHFNRGVNLNQGQGVNPPGSAVKVVTRGNQGLIAEARVPWSVLGVEDGRNPFKPGEKMTLIAEMLWGGGDNARMAVCYRVNPGTFSFSRPDTWGRLLFLDKSPPARLRPTMEAILAAIAPPVAMLGDAEGAAFEVEVPEDGLKVSVNILDPDGGIVRELIGGLPLPRGSHTFRWNGRDAWNHERAPGAYRWGAYMHKGLEAEFAGTVGTSGTPPEQTADNQTSRWGGDHSNPVDCAADASGRYFLWPVAEAGMPVVKAGYDGKTIWRKNPFVGGGFGPFYAIAADGRFVYLARGIDEVFVLRLDAATGALLTWGEGGPSEIPVFRAAPVRMPEPLTLDAPSGDAIHHDLADHAGGTAQAPNTLGLAVRDGRLWLSAYPENRIYVLDAATAEVVDTLDCPGPRGLSFDAAGDLLAVSFVPEPRAARVLRFAGGAGAGATLVADHLEAPCGVAAGADGAVYVTDLGASQQVKVFDGRGAFVKAFGKVGGRPWQGRYDADAFLKPMGLCLDANGRLLLAESSPPKVFTLIDPATGAAEDRWYGPGVYWNATFPDPDDPEHLYYLLNNAMGRARLAGPGKVGVPDAYWAPAQAGFPHVGSIESGFPQPQIVKADNGRRYFVRDLNEHNVYLWEEGDRLRPVATWNAWRARREAGLPDRLEAWVDANGDGRPQDNEKTTITHMADGTPLPLPADKVGSMHMRPNGDLYFVTHYNRIVKIPATGFNPDGSIRWALDGVVTAVPEILPGVGAYRPDNWLNTTWRCGALGMRFDREGNLYLCFDAVVPGKGGVCDYPDEAYAKKMMEGMAHTASFNVVKIAKYDPQGRLLWMAGRKATGGARPGEMYHFWNLAGLVNDQYVVGGSEWGRLYFYTRDGFYADALMNDPGDLPAPGPYTFGGETSGGRVEYFPDRDELWAYSTGMAYRVKGFEKGRIAGERRAAGTVTLDHAYASADTAVAAVDALRIARLPEGGDVFDAARWIDVPSAEVRKNGKPLARAQLARDGDRLHVRIEVTDAAPLDNAADTVELAFKGGDTAGIVLGPKGPRTVPGPGDTRLMAARVGGIDRLIAMKSDTALAPKPFLYTTPAGGDARFAFVGEVPDGTVRLVPTEGGYTAEFSVPLSFLELDAGPGVEWIGDVEIREGGIGGRGRQTMTRNYLFTPSSAATTMVDDVPTEARMYPAHWGPARLE